MFNRFVEVRFLGQGLKLGGRMIHENRVEYPPSIQFSVKHTSESSPNEAEINLINISPETQRTLLVEGEPVEIEAGYWPQDGARLTATIFKGQIRSAITNVNNGTESHTKIQLGDGDDAYSNARVHKVFKDKKHRSVVSECSDRMGDFGIEKGRIDLPDFVEQRPRTVDRLARRELDDIAYQHDLSWHIQDSVLHMYPRDEALERTAYVLTPNTGVINSPQFDDKGVNVKTLMIPDLRPGFTFLLKNDEVPSRVTEECKVENITFSGDNSGGNFGCDIRAKFLNGEKVIRARQRLIGQWT